MSASNEQSPFNRDWLTRTIGGPGGTATSAPRYEPRPVGAGDGDIYLGHAEPVRAGLAFKDHEVAQVVNEVRRIALEYGGSQQLRERLSQYLAPILKGERQP